MKHMRRCGRVVLACSALAMLAACSGQAHIGFSAYTDRPVVLTDMSINGKPVPLVPMVVQGRAERLHGRTTGGGMMIGYPAGKWGQLALTLRWVDLPTGQAWSAAVDVPLAQLERSASGAVELMPVFAPGGLLLITSDPIPQSADDDRTRDVLRLCASRTPAADQDFTADPTSLPALVEAVATMQRGPAPSSCF